MPRRTTLHLLAIILALTTGMALFGAALTIGAPGVSDPRPTATVGVARDFYAAVNESIRTGDAAGLEAVAAADLSISGAMASFARDRAGLARYLASVHALAPRLELVVERVVAVQDRAIVHLAVRDGEGARILGNPLLGGLPWGTVESLSVAGGRVVEYWSGAPGDLLWEPIGQTGFSVTAPLNRIVTLDRLMVPPAGAFAAQGKEEARLLVVEAGSVTVTAPHHDDPVPLSAGGFLQVPTWTAIEVRNDGQTPASLLVLAAALPVAVDSVYGSTCPPAPSPEAGSTPIDWRAGVAQTADDGGVVAPLAGGKMTNLPAERLAVAVGRLTLTTGVVLPWQETSGLHLLVVEQGVLGIDAGEDGVWIQRGADGHSGVPGAARLDAGNGATLDAGTTAVLDNPGPEPVVVTTVAILPGE